MRILTGTLLAVLLLGVARSPLAQADHETPVTETSVTDWTRTLDGAYAGLGEGVIWKNQLIIRSGQFLTAYDLRSGEYAWKQSMGSAPLEFGPYLTTDNLLFYIVKQGNGGASVVTCYDPAKQSVEWQRDLSDTPPGIANVGKYLLYQGVDDGERLLIARSKVGGYGAYGIEIERFYAHLTAAGSVVLADKGGDKLHAIDPAKGVPAWGYKASGKIAAAALYHQSMIYLMDGAGILHAIDPATQKAAWTQYIGGTGAIRPAASGAKLIVLATDGMLRAVDSASHKILWEVDTQSRPTVPPAIAGSRVIVALDGGRLLAVDLETGKKQWTVVTEFEVSFPMTTDGKMVYAAGNAKGKSRIFAINPAKKGEPVRDNRQPPVVVIPPIPPRPAPQPAALLELWSATAANVHAEFSNAAVDGNAVYVLEGSLLKRFDMSGRLAWKTAVDAEDACVSRVFEAGDHVYWMGPALLGFQDGMLLAAHRKSDGAEIWNLAGEALAGMPVTANGRLYAGYIELDGSCYLVCVDSARGAVLWEAPTETPASPVGIFGNSLIVSDDNELAAIDAGRGTEQWSLPLPCAALTRWVMIGQYAMAGDAAGNWMQIDLARPKAVELVKLNFKADTAVTLCGNLAVLAGAQGRLLTYDPEARAKVAECALPRPLRGQPVFESGLLFAVMSDRRIAVLEPASLTLLEAVASECGAGTVSVDAGTGHLAITENPGAQRAHMHVFHVAGVAPRPVPPGGGQGGFISTEEARRRLEALKDMFEDGLIPPDLYARKVQEVLDAYIK